jgi:predicted HTH transcriptional regulator
MNSTYLRSLVRELIAMPNETEWLEFKSNFSDPQSIGEYLSALSNSAAICKKQFGYMIWGIDDATHKISGTIFKPHQSKKGNQELESWLEMHLSPRINFKIHEFTYNEIPIVLFEIPCASHRPVSFKGIEYIRIGSYKKSLKEFPEKERQLWNIFERLPFELQVAKPNVTSDEVLKLIDYPAYFDLTNQPLPDNKEGILDKLSSERMINKKHGSTYDITNLGGIIFAKDLNSFDRLARKAIRVIVYKNSNRIETVREQVDVKGYGVGFERAITFISNLLPENEIIDNALRKNVRMYPEIAIRELVANAVIHQDFTIRGTGPMIEIFSDRIEVTNPGIPLIDTLRFIDEPPLSRNEALASFLRRINICEERGSGVDKIIFQVEFFQLPAPEFIVTSNHTKAILYAHKNFSHMDKADRIRACYQHACLRYVSNDFLTNTSLRERFSFAKKNHSMASRIIADTLEQKLIKHHDPENQSKKHTKYIPFWA